MRTPVFLLASLLLLAPGAAAPAKRVAGPDPGGSSAPDSAEVARFLAGLRASDPVVCALATDILGTGIHWRSGDENIAAFRDAPAGATDTRDRLRVPITAPGALRLLAPELQSPSACVRRAAAALLGESGRPEALAALRAGAANRDGRVREAATFGLGVAGDSTDMPRLRGLLKDDDPDVVRLAAWALGTLEDGEAERELVALLRHRHPGVRRSAAWALGQL